MKNTALTSNNKVTSNMSYSDHASFIFDLGYNYSVKHKHLYQSVFVCVTKYTKILFLVSFEIQETLVSLNEVQRAV